MIYMEHLAVNIFNVEIAGHTAQIETSHVRSLAICRNFITDKPAEFILHIDQQDIDKEREQYERLNGTCTLWDGALETLAFHRLLSERLIDYNVIMMHGAAISYNNSAFIFSAPSGTGKSTHIMKWLRNLPEAYVINGDKPFIVMDNNPMVCGSPWSGKEGLYSNSIVPLKAIVFMERSQENQIRQIPFSEAFFDLYREVNHTDNVLKMQKTLGLLQILKDKVAFYKFCFNNYKDNCFDIAYKTLVGGVK